MIKSHTFSTFDGYGWRSKKPDSDQWEGCFKYRKNMREGPVIAKNENYSRMV